MFYLILMESGLLAMRINTIHAVATTLKVAYHRQQWLRGRIIQVLENLVQGDYGCSQIWE